MKPFDLFIHPFPVNENENASQRAPKGQSQPEIDQPPVHPLDDWWTFAKS
jgi:hypothetical protein